MLDILERQEPVRHTRKCGKPGVKKILSARKQVKWSRKSKEDFIPNETWFDEVHKKAPVRELYPRRVRCRKLLLVLGWWIVTKSFNHTVTPQQAISNPNYYISLEDDAIIEESFEREYRSEYKVEKVSSSFDHCNTLNGSHGEMTEGDDIRVEPICHDCKYKLEGTYWLQEIMRTSCLWVQSRYCCSCGYHNGCEIVHDVWLQPGQGVHESWLPESYFQDLERLETYYSGVNKASGAPLPGVLPTYDASGGAYGTDLNGSHGEYTGKDDTGILKIFITIIKTCSLVLGWYGFFMLPVWFLFLALRGFNASIGYSDEHEFQLNMHTVFYGFLLWLVCLLAVKRRILTALVLTLFLYRVQQNFYIGGSINVEFGYTVWASVRFQPHSYDVNYNMWSIRNMFHLPVKLELPEPQVWTFDTTYDSTFIEEAKDHKTPVDGKVYIIEEDAFDLDMLEEDDTLDLDLIEQGNWWIKPPKCPKWWMYFEGKVESETVVDMGGNGTCDTLNGSHGEYTEGDDMEKNRNHEHNKKVNGGRNPDWDGRPNHNDNALRRIAQHIREQELLAQPPTPPPPPPPPPPPEVLFLVYEQGAPFVLYNNTYYVLNSNNEFVGPEGDIHPYVISNTYVDNVVSQGYGFVKTQAGKGVRALASASVVHCATECRHLAGAHRGFLVHPYLNMLKREFPSATSETSHARQAVRALAAKRLPTVPEHELLFTITFFFFYRDRSVVDINRLNTEEGVHEQAAYSRLGVVQMYSQPWRSYAMDSVALYNWETRTDVTILINDCVGVQTEDSIYVYADGSQVATQYHRFTTLGQNVIKFYHTHFFQFVGDNDKSFVAYEPNGHNANLALKRVFGCNDHNEEFMSYQYGLYDAYTHGLSEEDAQDLDRVLSVKRVSLLNEPFGLRVGKDNRCTHFTRVPEHNRNLNPAHLELYLKAKEAVRVGRDLLCDRVSQYDLDFFTDSLKTFGSWAYHYSAVAYYRCADIWEQRNFNVHEIQHHKKALRMAWFKGIQLHTDADCLVKKIILNVKKEWAKPGKVGRLFASYGAGGIYAPEIPEYIKACIHGVHEFGSYADKCSMTIYVMSKAKDNEINMVFQHALATMDTPNHIHYILYSDDSCMIGNYNGEQIMVNLDIASCDASNRFPIFAGLYRMMAKFSHTRALALLEQCTKDMLLVNPSDETQKMQIRFHSCMEGSGTVLTTVLNHTVSYDIGVSILSVMNNSPDISFEEAVSMGAKFVGHKLTVDHCRCPEELQFLKRSPLQMEDGSWHMCINYGTIFRGLGCVQGDLEPRQIGVSTSDYNKMTWKDRVEKFTRVVVLGLCHEPQSQILSALRSRFLATSVINTECEKLPFFDHHYQNCPRNHGENLIVREESLCKRYNLEPYECGVLAEQIGLIEVGRVFPSSACTAFFAKDYSL